MSNATPVPDKPVECVEGCIGSEERCPNMRDRHCFGEDFDRYECSVCQQRFKIYDDETK